MAELFLAQNTHTDQLVVIKRILPYLSQEPEFVHMFLDEARIASQLRHPNVVQLYELGKLGEHIFIAMEFVDGVDVRRLLTEEQKLQQAMPYHVAGYVIAQVCAGLHYAHNSKGVDGKPLELVHRDVSPQNVMVAYDGKVKLVDFGIAKASAVVERSKPGVIKGKFLYLSPEQVGQQPIDHRSDLFALGTMLYEVTTGRSPFHKNTTEAVIFAIRGEDPVLPEKIKSDYPPELSRIVMKCLVKDRNKRYQHGAEIQRDLEAWVRTIRPMNQAALAEYVDAVFGDKEERTTLHIPTVGSDVETPAPKPGPPVPTQSQIFAKSPTPPKPAPSPAPSSASIPKVIAPAPVQGEKTAPIRRPSAAEIEVAENITSPEGKALPAAELRDAEDLEDRTMLDRPSIRPGALPAEPDLTPPMPKRTLSTTGSRPRVKTPTRPIPVVSMMGPDGVEAPAPSDNGEELLEDAPRATGEMPQSQEPIFDIPAGTAPIPIPGPASGPRKTGMSKAQGKPLAFDEHDTPDEREKDDDDESTVDFDNRFTQTKGKGGKLRSRKNRLPILVGVLALLVGFAAVWLFTLGPWRPVDPPAPAVRLPPEVPKDPTPVAVDAAADAGVVQPAATDGGPPAPMMATPDAGAAAAAIPPATPDAGRALEIPAGKYAITFTGPEGTSITFAGKRMALGKTVVVPPGVLRYRYRCPGKKARFQDRSFKVSGAAGREQVIQISCRRR